MSKRWLVLGCIGAVAWSSAFDTVGFQAMASLGLLAIGALLGYNAGANRKVRPPADDRRLEDVPKPWASAYSVPAKCRSSARRWAPGDTGRGMIP